MIETERLTLRNWQASDAEPYYHINQDPRVTEFLPGNMTMEQVQNFIVHMQQQLKSRHYTLWAVEEISSGQFIGFIGLSDLDLSPLFPPCIEIGWRLDADYWGKGYATEGAKAALAYGFDQCGLEEVVAITTPANIRSIRVMEKIGLQRDKNADFAHPRLPADHKLSQHVFYRMKNPKMTARLLQGAHIQL